MIGFAILAGAVLAWALHDPDPPAGSIRDIEADK